jgi:hypothetical protein
MSTTIVRSPTLAASAPRFVLNTAPYLSMAAEDYPREYAISPDGKRFLFVKQGETKRQAIAQLQLVTDWPAVFGHPRRLGTALDSRPAGSRSTRTQGPRKAAAGASARGLEADRSPCGAFRRERNGDRARADGALHPFGHQPELLAAAIGARPVPNAEGDQAVEADRRLAFPDDFADP